METEINSVEGSVFVGDDIDWQSLGMYRFISLPYFFHYQQEGNLIK